MAALGKTANVMIRHRFGVFAMAGDAVLKLFGQAISVLMGLPLFNSSGGSSSARANTPRSTIFTKNVGGRTQSNLDAG